MILTGGNSIYKRIESPALKAGLFFIECLRLSFSFIS